MKYKNTFSAGSNYYDDYNFPNATTDFTAVLAEPVYYNNNTKPKGMPTGSWVRVLESTTAVRGENSYTLYDYKARPIRSFMQNYLSGYTQVDSKLDFSGKTLFTETRHKRIAAETEILVREDFTYSPQDRLLTHTHSVNGAAATILAQNEYTELGQLKTKLVGSNAGSNNALQKVDYRYNIRGWLTNINDITNLQQNSDPKDLFTFKLNYNNVQGNAAGVQPLFNGNIAETFWRTASDDVPRNYGYKYDHLNRLTDAIYQKPITGISNTYGEKINYDKNGNITALFRNGGIDGNASYAATAVQIDNLTYTYEQNSNKLKGVYDNSLSVAGFKDGGTTIGNMDYDYDLNGNLIKDDNKNIQSIIYNHLNLPIDITLQQYGSYPRISYIYNAIGVKVKKTVNTGMRALTSQVSTTEYHSGFQFKDNVLQFFPHAEGYVNAEAGTFKYVYNYTDHLGNVRLSYGLDPNNVLKIIEENNYYPFGMKHEGYNNGLIARGYKYKYQGQERQDELGLNWDSFKWRNYDYAIGRFMSIDPLAEDYVYNGPYNFAENRVIDGRELEGLEWVPSTQMQQFNQSAKSFVQTVANTLDNMTAKVSAFFAVTSEIAPNTKVEATTTASAGTNFLNFLNAKQFDQNTTVSPFIAKVETKVEVKVTMSEIKAKVQGVDINVKTTNITNVATSVNTTEVKGVVGIAKNGVFATNTTNSTTGANTTRVGVQLEAETPKVEGVTLKVGASFSVGETEKKTNN